MISALIARLGLDAGDFRRDLQAVHARLDSFGRAAKQAVSLGAVTAGLEAILSKAGKIADLGAQFGVGVEGLQRIGNVAEQNGSSLESVGAALNKISLAQAKVRAGDAEMRQALAGLNLDAAKFINLSPEEAFYALSDATAGATDRQAAYASVVQLAGKSSGELFSTLELGAEAISSLGDSIGVMVDETVQRLDELGDRYQATRNKFSVGAASAASLLAQLAEAAGATLGGMATDLGGLFSGEKTFGAQTAAEKVDEIFHPEKHATEKPKRTPIQRDLEEGGKASKAREQIEDKLAAARERFAEATRKADLEALEGQAKINALIAQRDTLLAAADQATDPAEEIEGRTKAVQLSAEIRDLERSAADERKNAASAAAEERSKALQQAGEEAVEHSRAAQSARAETEALQAEVGHHDALASKLRTRADFEDRILQAVRSGNLELAGELLKQQGITGELQKQEAAEKNKLSLSQLAAQGTGATGSRARRAARQEALAEKAALRGDLPSAARHQTAADKIKAGIGALRSAEKGDPEADAGEPLPSPGPARPYAPQIETHAERAARTARRPLSRHELREGINLGDEVKDGLRGNDPLAGKGENLKTALDTCKMANDLATIAKNYGAAL